MAQKALLAFLKPPIHSPQTLFMLKQKKFSLKIKKNIIPLERYQET